jgi:hypothetical protein
MTTLSDQIRSLPDDSKRGQRLASPSLVASDSCWQLPEHALYPAPGCVLNSCRHVAELLDAVVIGVRDVDVATGINRDTGGPVELSLPRAIAAPHEAKGGRQLAPCYGREQSADNEQRRNQDSHLDLLDVVALAEHGFDAAPGGFLHRSRATANAERPNLPATRSVGTGRGAIEVVVADAGITEQRIG